MALSDIRNISIDTSDFSTFSFQIIDEEFLSNSSSKLSSFYMFNRKTSRSSPRSEMTDNEDRFSAISVPIQAPLETDLDAESQILTMEMKEKTLRMLALMRGANSIDELQINDIDPKIRSYETDEELTYEQPTNEDEDDFIIGRTYSYAMDDEKVETLDTIGDDEEIFGLDL